MSRLIATTLDSSECVDIHTNRAQHSFHAQLLRSLFRCLVVRVYSRHMNSSAHMRSTCDSAESIATPPESDFDDEELRGLLASPLHLQERGASAERSQVYHSERENLMSSSSQDRTSTGKPVAAFSSQNRLKKETAASLKGRHQNPDT